MSKFYTETEVIIKDYEFDTDAIKQHINNYLKDNPLEEQWKGAVYSRCVVCDTVFVRKPYSSDKKYLELTLSYTDQGYSIEDSYIDEDLPSCDKFEAFLDSVDLPVDIRIPSGYYAK